MLEMRLDIQRKVLPVLFNKTERKELLDARARCKQSQHRQLLKV